MQWRPQVHADVADGRQAVFEQRGTLLVLWSRGPVQEPRVARAGVVRAAVGGRPLLSLGLLVLLEEGTPRVDRARRRRLIALLPLHGRMSPVVHQLRHR